MASFPSNPTHSSSQTTHGCLLHELQKIWDEIGESNDERDKMLLELEQECLDIYRRKVEKTRKQKTELVQALAEGEAEIARLRATLGERSTFSRAKGTLKEQLSSVKSILDDSRLKKRQRVKDFSETESHIIRICAEIAGNDQFINNAEPQVTEEDLTSKRLAERKAHLEELQCEKALRLQNVHNHITMIHELSTVMFLDFKTTIAEVHPRLVDTRHGKSKSISDATLEKLADVVNSLKQKKHRRLRKVQDLGKALKDLWSLLATPYTDQKKFEHVTCLISSSVNEVSRPGSLSQDVIEQAKIEVEHLNNYKVLKVKELVMNRQTELEEIYRGVHMDIDSDAQRGMLTRLIASGDVDMSQMLVQMDSQIQQAKESAQSRKDVLDKVEKWKLASKEEIWLDSYEKDENRYSAGRGVHKNLKRAEKARTIVSKIPSLVETLMAKVKAWEIEKGMPFHYDKEPLLQQLEEYTLQRRHREDGKRRDREQKRLQEQLATEKEALFGSRPNVKKPLGPSMCNNSMVGTPARQMFSSTGRPGILISKDRKEIVRAAYPIPLNFVALDPIIRNG